MFCKVGFRKCASNCMDYSPCYDQELFITGSMEAKQLLRFINNSSVEKYITFVSNKTLTDVKFSVNKVVTHDCCVIFRLQDKRNQIDSSNKLMPQGGSSFRTVAVNEWRLYSCPFIDYFNGTYDVVCRLYDECHKISIVLDYLDFSAFSWNSILQKKLLFSDSVCRQFNTKHHFDPYIGWYKDNSTMLWRWVRGDKEILRDDQLRSCIAKLPSPVFLFGDSHLRYVVYYWLFLLNKLTTGLASTKLYDAFTLDKFVMKFTTFTLDEFEIPNYGYVCTLLFILIIIIKYAAAIRPIAF